MSQRIGYGRVSTRDQNPDSQRDALLAAGCAKVFIDKASGKLAARPELDRALEYARPGDTFVITRLSRAARSLRHLLELADALRERDIDLVVLKQGIDTTTSTGRFAFHVLGAMDEFLRELIVEGTREGLDAARARGRKGGRPAVMTDLQVAQARRMYDEHGADGKRAYTVQQIADTFGVSRPTIYRYLTPAPPQPPNATAATAETSPGTSAGTSAGTSPAKPAAPAAAAQADAAQAERPGPPVADSQDDVLDTGAVRNAAEAVDAAGEEDQQRRERAEQERREFERRLKPVPELGEDGYLMAEWPGTGNHWLVVEGERIGYATKTTYGTRWEAHSPSMRKITGTGTYGTRREALVQVALQHHRISKDRPRRRRR
ncbi:recombinase family protein [Actinomadura napierensis]|uniref:Resolvase/invertase-type recombinase catalytic domain-containing protein n=1 Tax=Actinomadura napierensis TaxID=267854 RepID=A0ABN3AKP7_9ACTN